MKPIEKFIDVDNIYDFADRDYEHTDYVWKLAMTIMSDIDEENEIYCCYSMPIFKKRYNEGLIKMPLTYEDYINNTDIQETIRGIGYDVDKFWFSLLFIWDYCQGECFQVPELTNYSCGELSLLAEIIQEHEIGNRNPLNEVIEFDKEIKLNVLIGNKTVLTVETANAIKFLGNLCKTSCDELFEKMGNDEVAEMFTLRKKGTFTTRSNSYQIFIFAKLFNSLFNQWGMPNKTIRSGKNQISYSKQFLISRLIYLTRISDNEEFYYEPTTIKGYISRYKNKGIKADTTNRIYRNFDKGE